MDLFEQLLKENKKISKEEIRAKKKITESKSLKGKRRLKEAPDEFGLPTDDEIDVEYDELKVKRKAEVERERQFKIKNLQSEVLEGMRDIMRIERSTGLDKYDRALQAFVESRLGLKIEPDPYRRQMWKVDLSKLNIKDLYRLREYTLDLKQKCREEVRNTLGEEKLNELISSWETL